MNKKSSLYLKVIVTDNVYMWQGMYFWPGLYLPLFNSFNSSVAILEF
jgi:hypothetical protein